VTDQSSPEGMGRAAAGGSGEESVTAAGNSPEHRDDGPPPLVFDRHLVLDQLGGWRGMIDATLPTLAFILANAWGGLRIGIWAAIGAALLVFLLRLVRRESVQQAVSGLFAVGIAVAIAALSGQARDFFVLGIVRNAAISLVLIGSVVIRRPLVGVIAEFLAPSHLGTLASSSLPGLRRRIDRALHHRPPTDPETGRRAADPEPERPWRDDPRMLRAYGWLTLLWGAIFLLRVLVQGLLYLQNDVSLLGTFSLLLGLPVTAVVLVVTFWVVAGLHRHRCPEEVAETASEPPEGELPAA
jgi:Protein of unknown function (DUF3159)